MDREIKQDSPVESANQPKLLPYSYAKKHGVIVVQLPSENQTILYHVSALGWYTLSEISRFFQTELQLQPVDEYRFQELLAQTYQSKASVLDAAEGMEDNSSFSLLASQLPSSEDLLETQDDAPIIRLLNALFTQAIKQKASDIHIETYENRVLIRNRIDGVLTEVLEVQRVVAPLIISRVKVMAKLDIAEKRIPQDGRISLLIGGHNIDVRVSTLPSNHGERIVLRILDKQAAQLNLSLLGMPQKTLIGMEGMIAEPHGIILVTGPTGSGKTTSLYAMLTDLNESTRNILTIEDPIEYDLPGIGQTQVNPKVEMTFAKGLRAILRQDPDVVMIGEIRDLETADIAIQASLTGHLVLSTLHTNSALGALTRLQDMGVEPFLLASSLVGLIAQRLVRKLCEQCKKPYTLTDKEKIWIESFPETTKTDIFYDAQGCEACHQTGYKGRTGIYEVIKMDDRVRSMIHQHKSLQEIEQYIRPKVPSIRQDGYERVCSGQTSFAEIYRVTSQH